MNEELTITVKTNGRETTFSSDNLPIENFKEAYRDFLLYEHTTTQKKLWEKQKEIFESILNSEDPDRAYELHLLSGKTTADLARERLADE